MRWHTNSIDNSGEKKKSWQTRPRGTYHLRGERTGHVGPWWGGGSRGRIGRWVVVVAAASIRFEKWYVLSVGSAKRRVTSLARTAGGRKSAAFARWPAIHLNDRCHHYRHRHRHHPRNVLSPSSHPMPLNRSFPAIRCRPIFRLLERVPGSIIQRVRSLYNARATRQTKPYPWTRAVLRKRLGSSTHMGSAVIMRKGMIEMDRL